MNFLTVGHSTIKVKQNTVLLQSSVDQKKMPSNDISFLQNLAWRNYIPTHEALETQYTATTWKIRYRNRWVTHVLCVNQWANENQRSKLKFSNGGLPKVIINTWETVRVDSGQKGRNHKQYMNNVNVRSCKRELIPRAPFLSKTFICNAARSRS